MRARAVGEKNSSYIAIFLISAKQFVDTGLYFLVMEATVRVFHYTRAMCTGLGMLDFTPESSVQII